MTAADDARAALTEEYAALLAEHRVVVTGTGHGWVVLCSCGFRAPLDDTMTPDHHRAEVLAARVAVAQAEALEQAADEWDRSDDEHLKSLRQLAADRYRAGGPSMPTIWLREHARGLRGEP